MDKIIKSLYNKANYIIRTPTPDTKNQIVKRIWQKTKKSHICIFQQWENPKTTMQMQLPLFPTQIKLINNTVGFFEKGEQVYYLHNGSPIYCHDNSDLIRVSSKTITHKFHKIE